MNDKNKRIKDLFKQKSKRVLNVYCTAGFPKLDDTLLVMEALHKAGVDMIELGMPYSDPLADGPTIQASNMQALQNGMTISKLFTQLKGFRDKISLPVVLMGYLNPILQFGFEKFCEQAAAVGIDGLILPDLPMEEFEAEYKLVLDKFGLSFTFLVTPETSDERVRKLDALSEGFLYAVSSSSITGTDRNFDIVEKYLQRLESLSLTNPLLVGFGIKDKSSFDAACRHANGAIIGSAYVNVLSGSTNIEESTSAFIKEIISESE